MVSKKVRRSSRATMENDRRLRRGMLGAMFKGYYKHISVEDAAKAMQASAEACIKALE